MAISNGVTAFDSIPDAVEAFARGEFLVVLDAQHRENEGDLIIAASDFTPEKAAFMIRHTSGLLCAPILPPLAAKLELPQMVNNNLDPNRTAYTITIDAAEGTSTGISAQDRSLTCQLLADPKVRKETFRRPGHIVPLQAREGGVRTRGGHTEATMDFCELAGKRPIGVLAELVEDGEEVEGRAERAGGFGMMRRDGCLAFAKKYGLKVVTIEREHDKHAVADQTEDEEEPDPFEDGAGQTLVYNHVEWLVLRAGSLLRYTDIASVILRRYCLSDSL